MYTPRRIVDFHVHCFPDAIAHRAVSKLAQVSELVPETDGTVADTAVKLAQWGIDHAVVLNIATRAGQETSVNRFAASICNDTLTGFGSVHFASPDALSRLDEAARLGLKGIKFHPDYQGFEVDDQTLYPLYDRCRAKGLICVFHAGFDPISPSHVHAAPGAIKKVAERFPGLRMIFAHLGGTYQWEEVLHTLCGLDIYLDTAICGRYLDADLCTQIIRRHGAERVLFASDLPWYSSRQAADYLIGLPLSEEQKDLIFFRNAMRLLQLPEPPEKP